MKIEYDESADALYIYLLANAEKPGEGIVDRTEGDHPIYLDFTRDNKLIGIEILGASSIVDIENLKKLDFKKIG